MGDTGSTIQYGNVLTQEQVKQFERDGYVVLPNILEDDQLDRLVQVAETIVEERATQQYFTFSCMEKGMIFSSGGTSPSSSQLPGGVKNCFREVALRSKLGQVAAELMQLDPDHQSCRILRDVFLAKPVHAAETCDWHVDDQGFWPAQFRSAASEASQCDQHGINVWLALDDMPRECAGSMAVAPGSHHASWRERGYAAIGQDRREDRAMSVEDVAQVFANAKRLGTCTMGQADPELQREIESQGVVLDLKRGDAVFCTRLLFHRTLDVTDKGKELYKDKTTLNRYSIRYVPGSVRLPEGYHNLEWSLVTDTALSGMTLDEVEEQGGPCWYPKVWPTLDPNIDERLNEVATSYLDTAKGRVATERKVLLDLIQSIKEKQAEREQQQTGGHPDE